MCRTMGFWVGIVVLAGCGPAKELPKTVIITTEETSTSAVAVPTVSEPDAVKVVERALAVATDGHPERLNKVKANRAVLKGSVVHPRPGGVAAIVPTFRHIDAVWPDRILLTDEF